MWNTFQGDETADGDISDGTTAEPQAEEMKGGQAHQGLTITTRRQVPRLSCTTKKDAEKHGCFRVGVLLVELGFVVWASHTRNSGLRMWQTLPNGKQRRKREHNQLKRSIKMQRRNGMAEQTDEANIVERTYAHSTILDEGCMPTAKS